VNVAVYFAQILKIFARIMANFSALGMRPHPLHPHAVRLWIRLKKSCGHKDIPVRTLKLSNYLLAPLLSNVIKESMCDGVFPVLSEISDLRNF